MPAYDDVEALSQTQTTISGNTTFVLIKSGAPTHYHVSQGLMEPDLGTKGWVSGPYALVVKLSAVIIAN